MTNQVHSLLRARDAAFRSGDRTLYSTARANLRRGIKAAKADYKGKIEGQLNNPRQMWQGIQSLTNYKVCAATPGDSDMALAEELNSFFARFESQAKISVTPPQPPLQPTPTSDTTPLTVVVEDVRRVLRAVNPRKATGPDGVPGKVLKACADQLAPVFTDIFTCHWNKPTSQPA